MHIVSLVSSLTSLTAFSYFGRHFRSSTKAHAIIHSRPIVIRAGCVEALDYLA